MRAPHPSLRGLYRQAATPSQVMARLKAHDELLVRLDAEVVAGGAGGDELLVRLTQGLGLGEVLDRALARLGNAPVPAAGPAASRRPGRRDVAQPAGEDAGVPVLPSIPPRSHRAITTTEPAPVERRKSAEAQRLNVSRRTPLSLCALEPLSHEDAYEALSQRAERRGLTSVLHQPVTRDEVPPRVAILLQQRSIEFSAAPTRPPRREATADPQEPMQRLAETVERAERVVARRAAHAPVIADVSERDRPPIQILRDETEPAAIPIATLQRAARAQAQPVITGGFRRLVALVESQQPNIAAPPPLAPPHAPPPPALDDAALTARIGEILRRDAERHGIDTTGVEP